MSWLRSFDIHNHPRMGGVVQVDLPPPPGRPFAHAILTGPNGSGKSTTLAALYTEIKRFGSQRVLVPRAELEEQLRITRATAPENEEDARRLERDIERLKSMIGSFGVEIVAAPPERFDIRCFFQGPAGVTFERKNQPPTPPTNRLNEPGWSHSNLYEWLRHQHLQMLLARADGDDYAEGRIADWLAHFDSELGSLLELDDFRLVFERESYNLRVHESGHTYWMAEMADGHRAALGLVGELILRITDPLAPYALDDARGVVLIDEIETHLHPRLEERILPFLTGLFPNIQFVVTTHSPIVVASIPDAIVFDLATRVGTPSSHYVGKRYGELMKLHFGLETDLDLATTRSLHQLAQLARTRPRTDEQQDELDALLDRLKDVDHPVVLDLLIRRMTAAEGP